MNHRSRLVGKVHANAAPMHWGLMQISVGTALLLVSPVAAAEDGGLGGTDAEVAAPVVLDATLVDGAILACDGAFCETQTGTTCDVAGVSPGRSAPSAAGPLAILGVLALAVPARRRARNVRGRGRARRSRSGAKCPHGALPMRQAVPPAAVAKRDIKKVTTVLSFYKPLC
jgi:hypothetical protein